MKPPYHSIYQAPKEATCKKHGSFADKYGCKACRKEALDRHRSKPPQAPRNGQVDKRRRRKQTETPTTSQEE